MSSIPPRPPRFAPGSALLGLATLVFAATLALANPTLSAIYCDRLAPLAVLAALAACLIALCFRALAASPARRLTIAALVLASTALFLSARFIVRYRGACGEVQQRLQRLKEER